MTEILSVQLQKSLTVEKMPAFNRLLPLASLVLIYWGKYSTLPCNVQITGIELAIITLK